MAGALRESLRLAIDGRPVQSAHGTGIGSYTSQLLRALDRRAGVEFILPWAPEEPVPCLRNPVRYWPLGRDDRQEQEELPGWLHQSRAQLYHLTQNGLGWPRRLKIPLIVTLHDVIPFLLPEVVRPSYLQRFLAEVPGAAAAAARIVTVSARAKADICRVMPVDPDKVSVVPSGPAALFRPRPRPAAREFLARRYGIHRRFLLYVGGYNRRKNAAALVWSFARIARLLPESPLLVLAGSPGPHLDRLRELAVMLGVERQVRFPGFVPRHHLPMFYAGADLFCYPSYYEGFGLPPLEAMACGTPVIASNSSSLPEVLGEAAMLFPPEDTAAISRAMLRMLTEPELAAIYRERGLERAGMYRWDGIARKVLEVYQEVL